MPLLRNIAGGLRALFQKKRADRELDEELRGFMDMAAEEGMKQGKSQKDALRAVRLERGNVEGAREIVRSAGWEFLLETFWQDLCYGLRQLRRNPGFTAAAVLTLALGIGANTAIFGIVYAVVLRPLPLPKPDRLVAVYSYYATDGNSTFAYPNFLDWQRQNGSFAFLATYRPFDFTVTGSGKPEHVFGDRVSAEFFDVLGVKPFIGRNFMRADDQIGAAPVALVSEGFCQHTFGSTASILGRTITLDGVIHTIVGVIPASVHSFGRSFTLGDVYIPIGQWTDRTLRVRETYTYCSGIGRLKPRVTLAQARADMDRVAFRLAEEYPKANKDAGIALVPLKQDITSSVAGVLYLLLGAVGFVLLIACVNIANLLLARSSGRMREFAVRSALGATRGRCVRQLITESVLLAVAGGITGWLVAVWGAAGALSVLPRALPRASEIGLDTRIFLFNLGISLFASIVFGLAPALRMARRDPQSTLNEQGRGSSGTRHGLQRVFIVAETALALVLLTGAGLMIRTLTRLHSVNPGFNPRNVVNFALTIPPALASEPVPALREHFRQVTASMESLSSVEAASILDAPLPMQGTDTVSFWREGQPKPSSVNDMYGAEDTGVEPDYLKVMQIPLKQGRFITPEDTSHSQNVIVIDEVLAQKYFANENPIGKRIHIMDMNIEPQIVGVVGHVKHFGLAELDSDGTQAQLYYACAQVPDSIFPGWFRGIRYAVRTKGQPAAALDGIRNMLEKMNGHQTIYGLVTLDSIVSDSIASQRSAMLLLSIFAALALVLASIGIYGVISYVFEQRTHEIGVRIALGAQPLDVLCLVGKEAGAMAILGVLLGTGSSLGLTRLISRQLFGVRAYDPLTFACVSFVLITVAMLACYIPARRAMRVDPMIALRYE